MSKRQILILPVLMAMCICVGNPAHAQLSGHNTKGDFGPPIGHAGATGILRRSDVLRLQCRHITRWQWG